MTGEFAELQALRCLETLVVAVSFKQIGINFSKPHSNRCSPWNICFVWTNMWSCVHIWFSGVRLNAFKQVGNSVKCMFFNHCGYCAYQTATQELGWIDSKHPDSWARICQSKHFVNTASLWFWMWSLVEKAAYQSTCFNGKPLGPFNEQRSKPATMIHHVSLKQWTASSWMHSGCWCSREGVTDTVELEPGTQAVLQSLLEPECPRAADISVPSFKTIGIVTRFWGFFDHFCFTEIPCGCILPA